jgi:hypothetical protein
MIHKPHIEQSEIDEHLQWYKDNFEHVDTVHCSKCDSLLALEVSGGHGVQLDRRGVAVIPIGSKLLSSRVRLDESAGGPMMGYQCACGNDTRLSAAEKHHKPKAGWLNTVMPHEEHEIRTAIKLCGHKADYRRDDNVTVYEKFKVVRHK